MRWFRAGIFLLSVGLCLAGECLADDPSSTSVPAAPVPASSAPLPSDPAQAAPAPCSDNSGSPADNASGCPNRTEIAAPASAPAAVFIPGSPKDRKAAHHAFERGLKLQHAQEFDDAFSAFEEAARLAPQNAEYVAAREMTRQHLAGAHLQRGDSDLNQGRQAEAVAEFRTALNLDPQNEYAQLRALDAIGPALMHSAAPPQVVASASSLTVKPTPDLHDIHYRGDSRGLLTAVASSYGLTVVFDESFPVHRVRFDMDEVDFPKAIEAASAVTKSFCVPLEDTVLFAAADTPENHRLFDRMGLRSFHIPGTTSTQDLNELMNALRTLFEFRFVSLNSTAGVITIRGPINALEAATEFLDQLMAPRPELLLDVQVMEINHTYAKNTGLHIPNQFNLYNIPSSAFAALGAQSIQSLINQLISSGGINQAGNATIAALLSQLQSQGNSIFSQPLATFGGGITLMGLTLDQLAGALSLNESSVRTLEHVTLRASQQKEATFKLGSRYPVLNASFAPISNSSAIAGVIGNQSYAAPFPSVSYEDIGLMLKAKPAIHGNSDVALDLSLQFRSLESGTVNGVPIISQREFTGGILLKDGEPAFIAGMITVSDQRSLNGLPVFAQIPGFGFMASQHSQQEMDDELLILLTPHIVSETERTEAPEIWIGK